VLWRMFGPKKDEVVVGWRNLRYKEFHIMYSSSNTISIIKSKRVRLAGHVVRMGRNRNASRILVVNPQRKRPLRGTRRKWE
jgi:hypothetical protein